MMQTTFSWKGFIAENRTLRALCGDAELVSGPKTIKIKKRSSTILERERSVVAWVVGQSITSLKSLEVLSAYSSVGVYGSDG